MPLLQCNVTNCASNASECCCRPIIKVEGSSAKEVDATCCQNFVQQGEQPTNSFAEGFVTPNQNLSVKCAATDCSYNRNRLCSAETVAIGGCGATNCQDTSCRTFKSK